jgi:hypothetical protein
MGILCTASVLSGSCQRLTLEQLTMVLSGKLLQALASTVIFGF